MSSFALSGPAGEAYDTHDTMWVPLSTPYPLADPRATPLGFAQHVFEHVPRAAEHSRHVEEAAGYARSGGASSALFASAKVRAWQSWRIRFVPPQTECQGLAVRRSGHLSASCDVGAS